MAVKPHGLANRPGEPYPATFRISVDPPRIELGSPPRQGVVVPLDHEPINCSGPAGESNPDLLGANEASSRWTSRPSLQQRSVWELNPVFRLTTAACSHSTYRPKCFRIAVIPDGIEPSLSWLSPRRLCPWTTGSSCSDRGGRRTHKITKLSTSSLCRFAYPVKSQ
jgi:hypothetical protein